MENKPVVLFAFRGDPICFIHVLLNALDLNEKGREGHIILEGEAVTLVEEMRRPESSLSQLYQKVRSKELIIGACKACSMKLGADKTMAEENIPLIGEMGGHPSMADYMDDGYEIILF